jgi:hypothetical protein
MQYRFTAGCNQFREPGLIGRQIANRFCRSFPDARRCVVEDNLLPVYECIRFAEHFLVRCADDYSRQLMCTPPKRFAKTLNV